MDVQEVRKLDAYLKRLFGNARLRVVPQPGKEGADVFAGEERIGGISVDDEDEERSYNFEMTIALGASVTNLKTLEAYLRGKFGNERLRVVARPRKNDSAEVYVDDEYIGVLFFDEKDKGACFFEMAILALDLDEMSGRPMSAR